ncbi:hypothetical protein JRQ81_010304 [Phrynocephalus forsythii]|uniref:Uncharacterized protein n=1 Tax=Phrynocephalus forsythii TaxID=171643 RepID=A0A9Q1ARE6_9SAUR|nr:hypothetical protein JRQ81_010304 [Phrynocephalus forsythii]
MNSRPPWRCSEKERGAPVAGDAAFGIGPLGRRGRAVSPRRLRASKHAQDPRKEVEARRSCSRDAGPWWPPGKQGGRVKLEECCKDRLGRRSSKDQPANSPTGEENHRRINRVSARSNMPGLWERGARTKALGSCFRVAPSDGPDKYYLNNVIKTHLD